MINVVCGTGSTGRICTDRAKELSAQGHEVRIAYGRGEVPEPYRSCAVRIGKDADVYRHVLKARLFDAAGFGSRRATKQFIRWVREYDPDEIHLHNLHGYYIHLEVLFAYLRTCGKRIIWTLHDCWAFTGHCAHYMAASCDKWRTGCFSPCPEKGSYPKCLLIGRCRENYERKKRLFVGIPNLEIVVPSKWLAGEVKAGFLRAYPVEVITNSIDESVFRPTGGSFRRDRGLTDRVLLLGVAGTWTKRKGLEDFVRLSRMLDDRFRIVLVGVDSKQMRKLPDRIIGIRRTDSREELAAIYTAADVFINLTYEDNYPTVNLEAQACGTPVITYDTGGCRETIRLEQSAVVKTGDLESVIRELRRMSGTGKA